MAAVISRDKFGRLLIKTAKKKKKKKRGKRTKK